jgi:ABC-type lipoprotein release transport system permease subunit
MTSFGLAWRTATRHPGRTALAMTGVAIIGALLFDMLLLSRGLIDSFSHLLETSGYNVRVVGREGLTVFRTPIHDAARVAADIGALPEVEDVTLVRIEDAVVIAPGHPEREVTLVGTTSRGGHGAWTLLQGADLPAGDAPADRCPLIVARGLASRLGVRPGATLDLRVTLPSRPSALPSVTCRVSGIGDFAFATADDNSVATTMPGVERAAARGRDEADLVLVKARPSAGAAAAAHAIDRVRPDLHAYSNEAVVAEFNRNGFAYFRQISAVLSSVTLTFAFLLIATLLTVSTSQRLGEIAALRALGIGRSRISAMLLWESGVLVGGGGLLALPLGGALAILLDRLLRQMPGLPERLHFFVFDLTAVVQHVLLLTATAIAAAGYPVWLAARVPIAETLRREVVG